MKFIKNVKKNINKILKKTTGYEIKLAEKRDRTYSKEKKKWDYSEDGPWIGGRLFVSNLTGGYHGILKQWWEYYHNGNVWLLISENKKIAQELNQVYSELKISTLDYYDLQSAEIDIVADICSEISTNYYNEFNAVICQATLEHVYSPFNAMSNMFKVIRPGGYLFLHTQTPGFPYHGYPRDYQRFYVDWFEDIETWIEGVELVELFSVSGSVFAAYRKKELQDIDKVS